jgi:hypothetical protein
VREQVHPQQGHQVGERPGIPGFELQGPHDQHGNEGRPNLHLDHIGADPDKGIDLEALFQGLEEQFDLPAVLINGGNGGDANDWDQARGFCVA